MARIEVAFDPVLPATDAFGWAITALGARVATGSLFMPSMICTFLLSIK